MIMIGRIVNIRDKSPENWSEITSWCIKRFGPRAQHINEVAGFSPRGEQGRIWVDSYDGFLRWGDVYFRNEEDAMMFLLRWS